jgi:hypothetical protein
VLQIEGSLFTTRWQFSRDGNLTFAFVEKTIVVQLNLATSAILRRFVTVYILFDNCRQN